MTLPKTLTEALAAGQIRVLETGVNRAQSGREVPYDELYRASNVMRETPIQYIQRVADENADSKG